ncbi:hypothetical protein KDA_60670 [Dictyobacter alpinus]|uniref:Uncharacterized protein n=2 Tax=Dictyobacter alpinus TaxID=2014873 RepID=A0A402BGT4_9CHLR|nr:hypothetical protein KDA_60670 [Dictyobacter alpinus]
MQVDDIRLAFQYSQVTLPQPHATKDLYFFADTTDIWQQPAEILRDRLVATGHTLMPALEIIIANHIDTNAPLIIEGDGILPELLARPQLNRYKENGHLQAVFLYESQVAVLHANIKARGRGINRDRLQETEREAQAKWLYGQWLRQEAHKYNISVVVARPWETLAERLIEIYSGDQLPQKSDRK